MAVVLWYSCLFIWIVIPKDPLFLRMAEGYTHRRGRLSKLNDLLHGSVVKVEFVETTFQSAVKKF